MSEENIIWDSDFPESGDQLQFLADCVVKEDVVENDVVDGNIYFGDAVINEENIVHSDEIICYDFSCTPHDQLHFEGIKQEPTVDVKLEAIDVSYYEDIKPLSLCLEREDQTHIDTSIHRDGSLAISEISHSNSGFRKRGSRHHKAKTKRQPKKSKDGLNKNKKIQNIQRKKRTTLKSHCEGKTSFCTACNKELPMQSFFGSHLHLHYKTGSGRFTCTSCFYETTQQFRINFHVRRYHCMGKFAEKQYRCSLCQWKFYYKKDLVRHIKTHYGAIIFRCDKCRKGFREKADLKKHLAGNCKSRGKLQSRKRCSDKFICEHCSYRAPSRSYLEKHIKRHLGLHQYQCEFCEYKCVCYGDMKKHNTIHFPDRPFKCNNCEKTFKRRSHLVSHTKSKFTCSPTKSRRCKKRLS